MDIFRFKHFQINQTDCAMKIGTDAMVLGSWGVFKQLNPSTILDIGCGTGVLALMMAQQFPNAQIDAVEIDEGAAIRAKENINLTKLGKNCRVFYSNFLTHSFDNSYDLIISNPPYFENASKPASIKRQLARHNDFLPQEEMLKKVKQLMTENGSFALILPFELSAQFTETATRLGFHLHNLLEVFGKKDILKRHCLLFRNTPSENPETTRLIIREEDASYTNEYKIQTIDFHGVEL